jgi:hypothetical protein
MTVFRDGFTEGFNRFVTSTVAPVASGWSILPGGSHPLESAALSRRTPRNTKQCSHQIDEVSDTVGLAPAELGQNRKFFEDVRQGHDPKATDPQGLQC